MGIVDREKTLAVWLWQYGFQLVPHGVPLLPVTETALHEPFVLWAQMNYGVYDAEEHSLCLLLAGDGKLSPQQIARHHWAHHTIVHYDRCLVGATLPRGGGRFDGHPTAALLAGASCVLSSVHPVFDRYAAEFSAKLCAKVLDSQTPLPLGAALLQTRQEMGQRIRRQPNGLGYDSAVGQPMGTSGVAPLRSSHQAHTGFWEENSVYLSLSYSPRLHRLKRLKL